MNQSLQDQLAKVIQTLAASVQKTADFAVAELPDIANQYLMYGRVQATLVFMLFLSCFIISLAISLKCGYLSKAVDRWEDWTDSRTNAAVIGSFGALISGTITLCIAPNFLLVWIAPKVWLIREFINLVK